METSPIYSSFDNYPVDTETNLWVDYKTDATTFTLWSPVASEVLVKMYENGENGDPTEIHNLHRKANGIWSSRIEGDQAGKFYTYHIRVEQDWLLETPGIYAQAVGVNGQRAMVVDLEKTNPDGWKTDQGPTLKTPNEAVIYELHVRDLTTHPNSGARNTGKYLGLIEQGTLGPDNVSTGFDHIKELGITHVHLLPAFDHYSIDETRLESAQFNWGYDPQNYNVPEGSYASDPYNPVVRIREFKEMVKAFHDNGIGVILDVVYNHTGRTESSNFNQEVPGYYYRHNEDSTWSNASGCGNETASERAMMRRFMIESVKYWAHEYHIDGFRFDLMGIHDMETMNQIVSELKEINPNIFVYGEGWTAGGTPLPDTSLALKKNTYLMPGISAFSDDVRDGLKGSVFDEKSTGFVSGARDLEETIKFGIVGSIDHPQIDFPAVNYSDTIWANEPWQAVSYVSCHDNHTLYDKLIISVPDADKDEIKAMHKLAMAVVLTSQGIPFLHAGVEMMRSKGGQHNSYNLPDEINQIDWFWKVQHNDVNEYIRSLIALRKNHPAFFMPDAEMLRNHLEFFDTKPGLVGFQLKDHANGDEWKKIEVWYNASDNYQTIHFDSPRSIVVLGNHINEKGVEKVKRFVKIPPVSMMMAVVE